MGAVFEVQHLDIERHYAAKLLHQSENPSRTRHFRQEARTISHIGSPWIVEIFDFQELADGRLMYLMELVNGASLHAVQTARGGPEGASPCDPARLIGLARQVCKGLQAAHEVGFVHRDIKPDNIMLSTDSRGREHVKIVDFGLAALLEGPKESNGAGTPAYMSPEQCKGQNTDARTDIYSLGITLYELATGRLPFNRTDAARLRDDHLFEQAAPPSELVDGFLPAGFDALILRCMAKQPRDRYASAAELEVALIELQLSLGLRTAWDEMPAPVLPGDTTARLERGLAQLRSEERRSKQRRIGLVAALVGLVAVGGLIGWKFDADAREIVLTQAEQELAALSKRASVAAAHARWIYTPPDEPDADTAYKVLLELERLDDGGSDRAHEVGGQLREEFSSTLVGLGDTYWERAGGRGFAREFYAQALVFQPDHERASERAGLGLVALAGLRDKAARGKFAHYELVAVTPLASLAWTDAEDRLHALETLRDTGELSLRSAAEVDVLLEDLRFESQRAEVAQLDEDPSGQAAAPDSKPGPASNDPVPGPIRYTVIEDTPTHRAGTHGGHGGNGSGSFDGLLDAAKSAYRALDLDRAANLYHRVLDLDAHNVTALVGLHHISFDRGEFKDALRYAEKAAQLRPKRGDLHLFMGDACMKVFDYGRARDHYERADQLGDRQAQQRIAFLDDLLGKAPS
ncbi:serine/threonine protein kinase [Enhygromyxa salina]|uniref:Serine/threonine protein kinase n=2 Tax=Enhygromyxa salina TaxID=215803 RepID=A0A0C2D7X9_9BACT|nr:serine/threonine protein kinase [Enhygromyxa salina]